MAENTGMDFEIGSEQEVAAAKSKFITLPPGAKLNDTIYRKIELGMPDWDTPNVSIKFPVIVVDEGPDMGKEDKLSTGIGAKGWKLIQTLDNLKIEKKKNPQTGKISFDRTKIAGIQTVGEWVVQVGKSQGGTGGEFLMAKLNSILPPDFKIPDNQKIM